MISFCRICLQNIPTDDCWSKQISDYSSFNIPGKGVTNVRFKDVLSSCLPELNLNIPVESRPRFCESCCHIINELYQLKQQCKETENLLIKYVKFNVHANVNGKNLKRVRLDDVISMHNSVKKKKEPRIVVVDIIKQMSIASKAVKTEKPCGELKEILPNDIGPVIIIVEGDEVNWNTVSNYVNKMDMDGIDLNCVAKATEWKLKEDTTKSRINLIQDTVNKRKRVKSKKYNDNLSALKEVSAMKNASTEVVFKVPQSFPPRYPPKLRNSNKKAIKPSLEDELPLPVKEDILEDVIQMIPFEMDDAIVEIGTTFDETMVNTELTPIDTISDLIAEERVKIKTISEADIFHNGNKQIDSSTDVYETVMDEQEQLLGYRIRGPDTNLMCKQCRLPFSDVKVFDMHSCSAETVHCSFCDRFFPNAKIRDMHRCELSKLKPPQTLPPQYQCQECKKLFLKQSDALDHNCEFAERKAATPTPETDGNSTSSTTSYTCNICKLSFLSKRALKEHVVSHLRVKENTFLCSYCDKRLPNMQKWTQHQDTHLKNDHDCDVCRRSFATKAKLRQHMYVHKSDEERPFKCDKCPLTFGIASRLTKHNKLHAKTPLFRCDVCDKQFKNAVLFGQHAAVHERCQCTECGKTFQSAHSLNAHMQTHGTGMPHACTVCDKRFRTNVNIRRHMLTHSDRRDFGCELCGATYKEKYQLRTHQMTHTGETRFECDVCQKKFRLHATYQNHLKTHTGDSRVKRFFCNLCDKGFPYSSQLKQHMYVHNGENPYQCPLCPMRFRHSALLLRHRRLHNGGDTPRQCPQCMRMCSNVLTLKVHMRTHDDKNERVCKKCGKKFFNNALLKRHLRTHSEVKPYNCKICDVKYSMFESLRKHISAKHQKGEVVIMKEGMANY